MARNNLLQVVGCLALSLVLSGPTSAANKCRYINLSEDYELLFRHNVEHYWPERINKHYELLISQCFTESNLNPKARSPVGALGLCQIMPKTYEEESRRIGIKGKATIAVNNIKVSAAYMARLMKAWTSPRNNECLIEISWASYNAGMGNILNAQKLARNALCWENIRVKLPEITGKHAKETIDYVSRNWRHYRCIKGAGI